MIVLQRFMIVLRKKKYKPQIVEEILIWKARFILPYRWPETFARCYSYS